MIQGHSHWNSIFVFSEKAFLYLRDELMCLLCSFFDRYLMLSPILQKLRDPTFYLYQIQNIKRVVQILSGIDWIVWIISDSSIYSVRWQFFATSIVTKFHLNSHISLQGAHVYQNLVQMVEPVTTTETPLLAAVLLDIMATHAMIVSIYSLT